jgi:hypothetical protein
MEGFCEYGNEASPSIKYREFFDWLRIPERLSPV